MIAIIENIPPDYSCRCRGIAYTGTSAARLTTPVACGPPDYTCRCRGIAYTGTRAARLTTPVAYECGPPDYTCRCRGIAYTGTSAARLTTPVALTPVSVARLTTPVLSRDSLQYVGRLTTPVLSRDSLHRYDLHRYECGPPDYTCRCRGIAYTGTRAARFCFLTICNSHSALSIRLACSTPFDSGVFRITTGSVYRRSDELISPVTHIPCTSVAGMPDFEPLLASSKSCERTSYSR
ncbi:hypothetical protein J6590_058775 [Homalodisca vitripennis]|nr:hypothetical protein J6590_058775 [Homalodisca vitripennis]